MDFVSLILLVFILILSIRSIKQRLKRRGEPPGPIGLPILGSYFQMKPRAYLAFCRMRKQYGGVFSLKVGSLRYIVLTSYKSIKEALLDKGDNFSGRTENKFIQEEIMKYRGIALIDGPLWQEHRQFSLQTLKDFGLGRNLSIEIIISEWENLRHRLDQVVNTPVDTMDFLLRTVTNVICTMTFGEQPGYDPDDDFGEIMGKIKQNMATPFMKVIPVMFPQLYYLAPLIMRLPMMKKLLSNAKDCQNYIHKKIEDHKKTLDPEGEPRDFTDVYLLEQMKTTKKNNTFTDWQLSSTILELFLAGTDTTADSIGWAILWMSIKPDLQRKVQQEIDENIDASQLISYNDRNRLNLVQAFLDEVQRWVTVGPYSVFHRNFEDDIISGYKIPANSNIIPCLYAAHHDPDVWEKPEDFYPQHFLTDNGQYKSRKELITFSIGRRSCLGESLARMEYFIFFTSIIRRYRVSLDAASEKNIDEILLGSDGAIRSPGFHKIIFEIRE